MMVNFLKVSIPQAVSTVATINIPGEEPIHELRVSIPQAVSTVATDAVQQRYYNEGSFNTASGKYCCNSRPYKASIHGA